jgi:UPF0755 protein
MRSYANLKKILFASLTLILLIVGYYFLSNGNDDFPTNQMEKSVVLTVSNGEYGSQIANNAQKLGVVKSAKKLIGLMLAKPTLAISPGDHLIPTHIPAKIALQELLNNKLLVNSVPIIPGSTVKQFLGLLSKDHNVVGDTQVSSRALGVVLPLPNPSNSAEGEIGAATYSFAPGTTVKAAFNAALANFKINVLPKLYSYQGYSPYQELIIASLLQIEGDPKDYQNVAAVIYHRLKLGMPLQLNSTVQYALGLQGKMALSDFSTHSDSPFNTYLNLGLPPTPISTPSMAAILAARTPALNNYLYFITVKPGDTRFTNSYQEFLGWKSIYEKNLAAGLFK